MPWRSSAAPPLAFSPHDWASSLATLDSPEQILPHERRPELDEESPDNHDRQARPCRSGHHLMKHEAADQYGDSGEYGNIHAEQPREVPTEEIHDYP